MTSTDTKEDTMTHPHQHHDNPGEALHQERDQGAAVHDLDTAIRARHQLEDRAGLLIGRLHDGALDRTVPELLDEKVFRELGLTRHPAYPHIEIWLVTAYLFGQGCYADPAVREASVLPMWVDNFANYHHTCPTNCQGDGPATDGDCDRCEDACNGGSHQLMARFSRSLAGLLRNQRRPKPAADVLQN